MPPIPSQQAIQDVCRGAVQRLDEPPSGRQVVLDVVALPLTEVLQTHSTGVPGRLFAKDALVIRAGATVDLIPDGAAPDVWVEWGQLSRIGDGVRHDPCIGVPGWLVYTGGYYVDTPRCLQLRVRTGPWEERVQVGVGIAC